MDNTRPSFIAGTTVRRRDFKDYHCIASNSVIPGVRVVMEAPGENKSGPDIAEFGQAGASCASKLGNPLELDVPARSIDQSMCSNVDG